MDPKTAQLDPKLKEAYERVMGTAVPKTQTPQAPQTPQPLTPVKEASIPTANTKGVIIPPVQNPSVAPVAPNTPTPGIITNSGITTPSVKTPVSPSINKGTSFSATAGKGGSGGFPRILIFLFLLIFFVGYGIFWIKFFKLSVPYLSDLVIPGLGKVF
ncbi:MAG: hypothetical protein ABH816_04210 [Candidatus Levyibacteriota bacterium]